MKKYILLLILGFMALPQVLWAEDPAWETYIKAHKEAQVAFHHEVRLRLHELRDTIAQSQEMQIENANQRTAQFYYLSAHDPGRIVRNQGFSAFINFEWTDQDEARLTAEDKEYRKRQKKIDKLREKLDKNPDFQSILKQLDEIGGSIEYERIRNRFRFMPEEVEKLLNA